MCTTTRSHSSPHKPRDIPPNCPVENDGKNVRIIVFDPKGLIDSNTDLKHDALEEVGTFYNGLQHTPGLNPALKQSLSEFTFHVEYRHSNPNQSEKGCFGKMKFPFYIFNYDALPDSSANEMTALLHDHYIPEKTEVWKITGPDTRETAPVHPYEDFEKDWEKDSVLGFGIPGKYTDLKQPTFRKIGIIKIDAIQKSSGVIGPKQRFAGVLKHELGHMFALAHLDNTIMNEKYVEGFNQFTIPQIDVINETLKRLV